MGGKHDKGIQAEDVEAVFPLWGGHLKRLYTGRHLVQKDSTTCGWLIQSSSTISTTSGVHMGIGASTQTWRAAGLEVVWQSTSRQMTMGGIFY
jgi:hypothetical protein